MLPVTTNLPVFPQATPSVSADNQPERASENFHSLFTKEVSAKESVPSSVKTPAPEKQTTQKASKSEEEKLDSSSDATSSDTASKPLVVISPAVHPATPLLVATPSKKEDAPLASPSSTATDMLALLGQVTSMQHSRPTLPAADAAVDTTVVSSRPVLTTSDQLQSTLAQGELPPVSGKADMLQTNTLTDRTLSPDFESALAERISKSLSGETEHLHAAEPPSMPAMSTPAVSLVNQTSATVATAVIAPHVTSRDWSTAMGNRVVWMATSDIQSATLTLNPPDLGPVQVVLHVTNDHATANFSTAQPEVQQALESAMPKLREMMQNVGITLGDSTVNLGFSAKQDQSASSYQPPASSGRSSDASDVAAVTVTTDSATQKIGLINTFV